MMVIITQWLLWLCVGQSMPGDFEAAPSTKRDPTRETKAPTLVHDHDATGTPKHMISIWFPFWGKVSCIQLLEDHRQILHISLIDGPLQVRVSPRRGDLRRAQAASSTRPPSLTSAARISAAQTTLLDHLSKRVRLWRYSSRPVNLE